MIMSTSTYKKISVQDLDFDILNSLEDRPGWTQLADGKTTGSKSFCVVLKEAMATNGAVIGSLEKVETDELEEVCLDNNRVVVSQGYEVKEILFPQEYVAISVTIQPHKGSSQTIKSMAGKVRLSRSVQSLEIFKEGKVINLVVKFTSKRSAATAFKKWSRWVESEKNVAMFPKIEPGKKVANYLKVSCPEGNVYKDSVVVVNISYNSFQEANECINNLKLIFPQRLIMYDSGEMKSIMDDEDFECGICFCQWEDEYILLSCQHIFCTECMDTYLGQQPSSIPVKCPECQIPMALNDIAQCASKRSLEKILEVAVSRYVMKCSNEIIRCPSTGCDKLLASSSQTTGKAGGEFIFCSACMTTYCVICSANLCKPVISHEDYSCESQNGVTVKVRKYVRDIQKILNLNCPRCKTPFLDFDACPAVRCGSCECYFCGLCLQDCGNSNDAHTHIKRCPKNFLKKLYFVDTVTVDLIHRELRVKRILDYFLQARNLNKSTYQNVLTALRSDLTSLGINTDWFIPNEDMADNEDDRPGCQCAKIVKIDKKRSPINWSGSELDDMRRILERQTKIIEERLQENRRELRRRKELKKCSIL